MDWNRLEIRRGTSEDFEFLWRLQCEAMRPNVERQSGPWDEAFQRDLFEPSTDPTAQEILELDNERIGCQWVRVHSDGLELVRLHLLPSAQGCGIGTYLIERLLSRAARAGLPVRLQVFPTSPARDLYARLGFRTVERSESHESMEHSSGVALPMHTTEEYLASITVGERAPHNTTIHLAPYDPEWATQFSQLAARVREALSERLLLLEHVGSTSVAGLSAKPVIDMVLVVAASADESSYVPALEAGGFKLRIREPDWFEHRLLKGVDIEANLHVFSLGCEEIDRMLVFRDHLRRDDADRRLYEEAKQTLAAKTWTHVQNYADAKSEVVRAILERALPGSKLGGG